MHPYRQPLVKQSFRYIIIEIVKPFSAKMEGQKPWGKQTVILFIFLKKLQTEASNFPVSIYRYKLHLQIPLNAI